MEYAHVTSRRMPAMKSVGERGAGNPHAAFDERGEETDRSNDTALLLDSTSSRRPGLLRDSMSLISCLWRMRGNEPEGRKTDCLIPVADRLPVGR